MLRDQKRKENPDIKDQAIRLIQNTPKRLAMKDQMLPNAKAKAKTVVDQPT
jgi:hypothetical protein